MNSLSWIKSLELLSLQYFNPQSDFFFLNHHAFDCSVNITPHSKIQAVRLCNLLLLWHCQHVQLVNYRQACFYSALCWIIFIAYLLQSSESEFESSVLYLPNEYFLEYFTCYQIDANKQKSQLPEELQYTIATVLTCFP